MNNQFSPTQLTNILKKNICEITYSKKTTGEIAKMRCSLRDADLPATTGVSSTKSATDIVTVYNLDKAAWRSFSAQNVKQIEILRG